MDSPPPDLSNMETSLSSEIATKPTEENNVTKTTTTTTTTTTTVPSSTISRKSSANMSNTNDQPVTATVSATQQQQQQQQQQSIVMTTTTEPLPPRKQVELQQQTPPQQQYQQHTPPASAFRSLPLTKERPPSIGRSIPIKTVIDPLEGLQPSNSFSSFSSQINTTNVTSSRSSPLTTAATAKLTLPSTINPQTNNVSSLSLKSLANNTDNNNQSNIVNSYGGNNHIHNASSTYLTSLGMNNTNKALFENLNRNFAEKSCTDIGLLGEQACLASFVEVFLSGNNKSTVEIPVVVVEGLWKNVVLPPLLVESDQYNLKEEDLVPQIWNLLEHDLQYLMRSPQQSPQQQQHYNGHTLNSFTSNNTTLSSRKKSSFNQTSSNSASAEVVRVVHGVYVEYGQYVSGYFDVDLWKARFGEYLTRMLLKTGDPLSSSSVGGGSGITMTSPLRTTSFEIVTIQKYATQHILEHLSSSSSLLEEQQHSIVEQLLTTPLFLKQIWRFGFPQKNVLQLTKEHLHNISKYHGTGKNFTNGSSGNGGSTVGSENSSYHPRHEHYRRYGKSSSSSSSSGEVINAWHALLEQEADGLLLALPIFSTTYNYYSSGDERDSHSGHLSSGNEDAGTVSSGENNSSSGGGPTSAISAALSSLTGSHHRRRRRSKQKSNSGSDKQRNSSRGGRKRRRILQKLLKRPTQMLVLGRTLFELGNAHPERRAELYIQSLEMMAHLLLEGLAINKNGGDDDDDDEEDSNYPRHQEGGDGATSAVNSTASQKIIHRLCALLCAESFMALSQCLAEAAEASTSSSRGSKSNTATASIARSRSSFSTSSGTSFTKINNMAELDNDIELLTGMFAPVFAREIQQKNDPTNYPGLEDTDNESDDGDSSTQNSAMLSHAFSAREITKGNRAVHCLKLARRLLKCGSAGTETDEALQQTSVKKRTKLSKDTEDQDIADTTKTFKLLKENLYAQVNDTMGRLLYDKEQYGSARDILVEASNRKRSVLALLRDDEDDTEEVNDASTNGMNGGNTASTRDGDGSEGSSGASSPTVGSPQREPFKRRPSSEDFVTSAKSHSFFTSWRTNNSAGSISAMSAHQNHPYYSMQYQLQRKICDNLAKQLCLTNRLSLEQQISEMEMSLASTLQYTGLAMHGNFPHHLGALTWLQEALILKTMHLGKMDLEVARLHAKMGAVHDDLGQYDTSVSRYRECLRIRMHFLNKSWSSKLFQIILGTLRDMGNAYRMLGDYDNAVGCYWKVALMSRKQWEIMRQQHGGDGNHENSTHFCGFGMDSHKGELCPEFRSLPLPHLILDELRNKGNRNRNNRSDRSKARGSGSSVSSEENSSDDGNDTNAPPVQLHAPPPSPPSQRMSISEKKPNPEENEMLREAAQAHQTVINLLGDKASNSKRKKKIHSMQIGVQNGPLSLANLTADEDIPLLLSASYQLGVIHMFFGEYGSAIARLEHSLRSLWILDPCSSESSSSDGSASDGSTVSGSSKSQSSKHRRRLMKRIQKRSREIFDKNTEAVDEEGIYHTLGLSRAACNEHDRAIRYLLTALRYARRSHGVDSMRAADILYDAGTSYWYMNEYEKACEFWSACLQIRILHQPDDDVSRTTDSGPTEFEFAKTLFNVAASHCAMGRYTDPRTTACLEDARKVFLQYSDDEEGYYLEAANCSFYLALVHYYRGLAVGNNPNTLVRIETEDDVYEEMTAELARVKLLESASKHLQEAGTIYQSRWYSTTSAFSEDKDGAPTGGPILKAHYLYLQGSIVNALGKPRRAIGSFAHACHIYKSNGDTYLVYAASVLYAMGQLYTNLQDDSLALKCFNESLQLRQKQLGGDHGAVGTALFELANIHARLNNYSIGIDMFQEALRIRLLTSGKDSANVAMTLLKMGALYAREGFYGHALDRLEGALRIRRDRVKRAESKRQQQEKASREAYEGVMDSGYGLDMARLAELEKLTMELVATEEIELGMVVYCMGNIHAMSKEYDTAIEYYEESLELRRKYVANESSLSVAVIEMHVADTLHNLGHVFEETKECDKALECYREALAIKRCYNTTQHAKDEQIKPRSKSNSIGKAQNESEEQIVFYNGQSHGLLTIEEDEDSVAGGASNHLDGLSFDHNGTLSYAATLYRIGSIYYRLRKNKLAINCFETALRIRIRHLGAEHNGVAQTLTDIGNTLRRIEDRQQDALQCYSVALRIRNKHLGPSNTEVGRLLYQMGGLHDLRKDYGQAVSCYRYAVRVYGRKYIHTLGQSMCRAILLQKMLHNSWMKNSSSSSKSREERSTSTTMEDEEINRDLEDMMLPSTVGCSSMEERDKTNRDYYLEVSSALREATQNKTRADEETILVDLDMDSPECWISVELFLLGLLELMHIMAGELDDVRQLSAQKTAKYLETIAADAIVNAEDTAAFNMLYLIQE